MRPANQQQAIRHMDHLLERKLSGNRNTKVKEHRTRAKQAAVVLWQRFHVGPYQYQLKHMHWYIEVYTKDLAPNTRYRHLLTVRNITQALNKNAKWIL